MNANQKQTLRQALCQRGLLYRRKGMLEEARSDLGRAAEMGSKFAKNQVKENNQLLIKRLLLLFNFSLLR